MGSLLASFIAMLTRDKPVTGVVVLLDGGVARIATSGGMILAKAGDGIASGARVRVVDGVARPAITPTNAYSV